MSFASNVSFDSEWKLEKRDLKGRFGWRLSPLFFEPTAVVHQPPISAKIGGCLSKKQMNLYRASHSGLATRFLIDIGEK
jgi:hypothetical protein